MHQTRARWWRLLDRNAVTAGYIAAVVTAVLVLQILEMTR